MQPNPVEPPCDPWKFKNQTKVLPKFLQNCDKSMNLAFVMIYDHIFDNIQCSQVGPYFREKSLLGTSVEKWSLFGPYFDNLVPISDLFPLLKTNSYLL